MRIGLYFGSFNPIHVGHMIIAETVRDSTLLEEVWFVVSPQNPFKKGDKDLLHEFDRLEMVEKSIADNYQLRTCDIEFRLPKPSYTIDTLIHLKEKYPQHIFVLMMGADNLQHLHKWKNFEAIIKYYPILVYPRPNSDNVIPTDLEKYTHQIQFVEAPLLDISATYIRRRIKEGKSVRYLISEEVATFIKLKEFYKD